MFLSIVITNHTASNTEKPKVKNAYLSIPKQLAKENKKFQFSVVEKKATARKYENSIEWLRDASLARMVMNVTAPDFPLTAYEKENQYKLFISDIGLLVPDFLSNSFSNSMFIVFKPESKCVVVDVIARE